MTVVPRRLHALLLSLTASAIAFGGMQPVDPYAEVVTPTEGK